MRKIIMAINTTPDGFCDHRSVVADNELHKFYSDLLRNADTMIFGRKTFQLLEAYWPEVAKNKTGTKEDVEFAELSTDIHKIVFSKNGIKTNWKNTTVLNEINPAEIKRWKEKQGKDMLVGSPSIIDQLIKLGLIDEYYFLVQPMVGGNGKRFFEKEKLETPARLVLHDAKFLKSGVIALCYRSNN